MYYRRKTILALLQQFGGSLTPSPFQQLLFIFTRRQQNSSYEFIPYTNGPLSVQARTDKSTMTKYEWLDDSEEWQLHTGENYIDQLDEHDQEVLKSLYKQFGDAGYETLIRHICRVYPFYGINLESASEYLDDDELDLIEEARPWSRASKLYTIGYEGIKAEAYMNRLVNNDIRLLVDVRKNSRSMKFGFNKSQLQDLCEKIGIEFLHIPELGIASDKRKNVETEVGFKELLEEYERETLPDHTEQLQRLYSLFKEHERVALTCYEKDSARCHRHKISDYLYSYDVPVKHL